jgi:tetraacyldisaccharide 4'-kinase
MSLDAKFQAIWYRNRRTLAWPLLLALSGLFGIAVRMRRYAFRRGLATKIRVSRPVVVIGNLSVGGTGKTPLVIWLAQELIARGIRVGVITRGYGGRATDWPQVVTSRSDPALVGDEPVLIAARTQAIVVAGPDRVADAKRAIELGAKLLLSDDGLQHYPLERDLELVVLDSVRGVGNGRLLPAGPLREPLARLGDTNLLVLTDKSGFRPANTSIPCGDVPRVRVDLKAREAVNLVDGERRPLEAFRSGPVHAVAAIGNPDSFFAALESAGLIVDKRALPDHAGLTAEDVSFPGDGPVLMTEKDAVKCHPFAVKRQWAVPLAVEVSPEDRVLLWKLLEPLAARTET